VAFRKKIHRTIDELPADLDAWIVEDNERRPRQGRWGFGNTPRQSCVFRAKSAADSGMKSATDSNVISAIPI
jgi:hypothetical protein